MESFAYGVMGKNTAPKKYRDDAIRVKAALGALAEISQSG